MNGNHVDHNLVQVSCGENHTVLVSDSGRLFTFGDGRHGKLCLDVETTINHFLPANADRFRGFKVENAQCGGCHTMVVARPIPGHVHFSDPTHPNRLMNGTRPLTSNGKRDADGNLRPMRTGEAENEEAAARAAAEVSQADVTSDEPAGPLIAAEVNVEARRRHREMQSRRAEQMR